MIGSDYVARRKVKKKARRIATFGLVSIILILFIIATLGGIFIEIVDKYKEKEKLQNKLLALEESEKELQNDVNKLEVPEYLSRYVRKKFLLSKDGELILRIPEEEK